MQPQSYIPSCHDFFFQKALRLYGYYKDAQFFCVFDQKKIKKKERKQIHEI
jgi:hypothetical protein